MNHNLAWPWADGCSPPQTPFLSFRSTQSEDMLFKSGEKIEIVCQAGLRSSALRWRLHRNAVSKPFRDGTAEPQLSNRFLISIATAGLHPGFYDLRVELDTGMENSEKEPLKKRPVRGVCTFGWKADQMPLAETRPADFGDFWEKGKAELAKVPLDPKEGPMQVFGSEEINEYNVKGACLPPDFDPEGRRCEKVESCKVDFAGPGGGRVYGWLAKPEGKGPFPAMLVLPGAGFAARPRPLEHARHGYLSLDIQIHGQEVDLPKYEPLPGYNDSWIFEPPEKYYFRNVYLRAWQGINYLVSRPDVDPKRIVVVGGSQGGRLSIVVSALDQRVAAAVVAIANSPNWPHLRWVTRLNGYAMPGDKNPDPGLVLGDGMDVAGAPPVFSEPADRCMAYYDPMNFAPDAQCPVMFNAGLIDPVSPPYSVFAAFNRWGGKEKIMVSLDGLGHDWCAEFDRRAFRWLDNILGIKKAGNN